MYEIIFLYALAGIWILFATMQDFKRREVANWLSFSLIIFALGFRFFYSLFNNDFSLFYQGLIGLAIFFIIGNVFYYSRLFAGGDAKLMISLGAVLPISNSFFSNLNIFIWFLLIFLICGAVYSVIWSLFLSLKNFKSFKKDFFIRMKKNRKINLLVMFFGLIIMFFGFFYNLLLILGISIFIMPYLYAYTKSVDETCMIKKINSRNLTEGDWLYKDLKLGNKKIKANWEGLTKEEIKLIQKRHKFVLIRQGIPFVPVFFIGFLVFVLFIL